MKKKLVLSIASTLVVILLLVTIWLVRIYATYGNLKSNTLVSVLIGSGSESHQSPNGEYYFTTEIWRRTDWKKEAYLCVLIRIYDKSGEFLQEFNTHASDVHKWSATWKDDETILMESSDIGGYEYTMDDAGKWVRVIPPP